MTTRMRLFRRDYGHSVCLRALVFVLVLLVILLVASRVESKTSLEPFQTSAPCPSGFAKTH